MRELARFVKLLMESLFVGAIFGGLACFFWAGIGLWVSILIPSVGASGYLWGFAWVFFGVGGITATYATASEIAA